MNNHYRSRLVGKVIELCWVKTFQVHISVINNPSHTPDPSLSGYNGPHQFVMPFQRLYFNLSKGNGMERKVKRSWDWLSHTDF